MNEIKLEVITPSKAVYSGKIKSITVPGSSGSFQVLLNHAPIISTLEIGKIKILEHNGKNHEFSTSGGTIEVIDNKILILVESFEKSDEIDIVRAKEALMRAKERLASKKKEVIDLARAEASLKRAVNRLKLRGEYKIN